MLYEVLMALDLFYLLSHAKEGQTHILDPREPKS